jgi:hypothetical protein
MIPVAQGIPNGQTRRTRPCGRMSALRDMWSLQGPWLLSYAVRTGVTGNGHDQ